MGYSSKINDPAMARYLKQSNQWSAVFASGLAVIAVIGFYIAGETGSELENPEALYIGLTIGSMFLLIAFYQILSRKRSKTWDGVVVDKQIRKKRRQSKYDDSMVDYVDYKVFIQSNNGEKHTLTTEDDATQYDYYRIGDKVRHHGGLNSFEKFDKTGDTIIFCNACASLNDIQEDYCFRCKCPLLK